MSDAKIYVDDSTITSHVKRIRKKFIALDSQFDCIDTVYGMGYRWEQPTCWDLAYAVNLSYFRAFCFCCHGLATNMYGKWKSFYAKAKKKRW